MNKLKRMNGRERTFLLITIPILALFFCFNTLPLIKGVIYSFTNCKSREILPVYIQACNCCNNSCKCVKSCFSSWIKQ